MKTGNKKKIQKKIQIKVKMPLSIQFFRDAEAEALHVQRCQQGGLCRETPAGRTGRGIRVRSKAIRMTQDIYWELLIWLFRSFMGVTAFAFTVAAYQAMRCRKRTDRKRKR